MHLAAIAIYPIKGCYRVEIDHAEVEPWGLAGDRRWLVIDPETRKAITQREVRDLIRVRPTPTVDGLVLRTDDLPDLVVPSPVDAELIEVNVFRFTGTASIAGPAADDWLSEVLQRKVRLVWLDNPTRRRINPENSEDSDRVSFADGYPVSLTNMASLANLNDLIAGSGSMEGPLPMTRFRPNLVIAGAPAWVEDEWSGRRIRIGEVAFRVPGPIDRCLVTTIDQESGEKGKEPLITLGGHRNIDQDLLFATNLIPDNRGHIAIGDPVTRL
jgi:uncharacterized protein YcbX